MDSHWIENFTSTSYILGIVLTKTFVDLNRYFVKNKVNNIYITQALRANGRSYW